MLMSLTRKVFATRTAGRVIALDAAIRFAKSAFRLLAAMVAVAMMAIPSAFAAYPEKTVRIVVPYTTGGGIDVVGRLIADSLSKQWGQGVVVDNRPGGGSVIGIDLVAKSAPDGYTLLMISNSVALSATSGKLPYDILKDFSPVTLTTRAPFVLAVSSRLNATSVSGLVGIGKSRPGGLNMASAGQGTMTHMAVELFRLRAGVPGVHVPYKGSSPAMADLIDGRTDLLFASPAAVMQQVKDGTLRVLAVTTRARAASVPTIPTMVEAGVPDFDVSTWFGLVAPAGTPSAIVDKIAADVRKVLTTPDMIGRLEGQGLEPAPLRPEEFADLLRREVTTWGRVIKESGVKLD